jgi:hypothetical protein
LQSPDIRHVRVGKDNTTITLENELSSCASSPQPQHGHQPAAAASVASTLAQLR